MSDDSAHPSSDESTKALVENLKTKAIKDGFGDYVKALSEVAETGQAQPISKKALPAKRNKTVSHHPGQVEELARTLGVAITDRGKPDFGLEEAVLVPDGDFFLDGNIQPSLTISAQPARSRQIAIAEGEAHTLARFNKLMGTPEIFEQICEQFGLPAGRVECVKPFGSTTSLRDVAPHSIAGVPAHDKMRVEVDNLLAVDLPDGSTWYAVVEHKADDVDQFSTAQATRNIMAFKDFVDQGTKPDEYPPSSLPLEPWQVHGTDTGFKLYRLAVGNDVCHDRKIADVIEIIEDV